MMSISSRNQKLKKSGKQPLSLLPEINYTFKEIENKVKFRPTHYLTLILNKNYTPPQRRSSYKGILENVLRIKDNNPEYEDKIDQIITLTQDSYFEIIQKIEKSLNSSISLDIIEEMNKIISTFLQIIYEISKEPFPLSNQQDLFDYFKYSWLDNPVLTQFFSFSQKWNPMIKDKYENLKFLHLFINTFESLVFKLGKHLLYNQMLIVGTNQLTNTQKIAINSARALFMNSEYKRCVQKCHDILEETLRMFIYNILLFKYGKNWTSELPKEIIKYINNIKKKEKKKYNKLLNSSGNELYYLSREKYVKIILDPVLWDSTFKYLFGTAYRSLIKESLEGIADVGHLEKHNRKDEDFTKIIPLIREYVLKTKIILEILNQTYVDILNLPNFIFNTQALIPRFHGSENCDNIPKIEFSQVLLKKLREEIEVINLNEFFIDRFIDLGDQTTIAEDFSIDYRVFIGNLIKLVKDDSIAIKEQIGSTIQFKLIEKK